MHCNDHLHIIVWVFTSAPILSNINPAWANPSSFVAAHFVQLIAHRLCLRLQGGYCGVGVGMCDKHCKDSSRGGGDKRAESEPILAATSDLFCRQSIYS